MMTQWAMGALVVAMISVLAVLGMGLYTMLRGNDVKGRTSNKLMWWRIYLQAIALALFAVVLVFMKKNG